ncbi:MAG: hypothetical protein ABW106_01930 [Steroidobacteraceae bacterium]
MARIEVKDTGEFAAADDKGEQFVLIESSTIHVQARENAPVQSQVTSKSYRLKNGLYVKKTGPDVFEVERTGVKLKRLSSG